jgi:plastocyanin
MKRLMVFSVLIISGIILSGIMVSCDDEEAVTDLQPANEVWMNDTEFIPVELVLTEPSLVRWVNNSNVAHTVTSNDGLFDQRLEVNETFEYFFDSPGTYPYFCRLHPGMLGSIVVE